MELNLSGQLKKINQFYLAGFIIFLLGLYLIWQMYGFYSFLSKYSQEPEFLVRAKNYSPTVPPRKNLPDLASYNLFGIFKEKEKPTIKVSDLDVTVIGIFADTDPKKGTAVIDSNGRSLLYIVGDKIKGVAVIDKILPDKVVIDLDGSEEYIPYDDKNLQFSGNTNDKNFPPRIFNEEN